MLKLLAKTPEARPFNARAVQGLLIDHLTSKFGPDLAQLTSTLPPLEVEHAPKHRVGIAVGILLIAAAILAGLLLDK